MISNAPYIAKLKVLFEIEVMADCNLRMADNIEDIIDDSDDENREKEDQMENFKVTAVIRTTELAMDSKLWDSLLLVTNARSFEFKYECFLRHIATHFDLTPKHVKQILEMHTIIEKKFKEPIER